MTYKIISATEVANLIWDVNESIKEGWMCQGGMCVKCATEIEGLTVYYQAMLKMD